MAATKTFFKQIPVKVVSKIAKVDIPNVTGRKNGIKNAGQRAVK